jgi:hypothetical protein
MSAMGNENGAAEPLCAVLFDVGDTLEHDGVLMPAVPEALAVIAAVETPAGARLRLGLVSDVAPTPTPAALEDAFADYVERIRRLGLLRWFEPPEEHVTLSAHVGVAKPDARVFAKALARLGLPARLATAAFFTEDAAHVAACRALGMHAFRVGPGGDVDDWAVAPLLLRQLARDDHPGRLLAALNLRLEQRFGMALSRIEEVKALDENGERAVTGPIAEPASPDGSQRLAMVTLSARGDVASLRIAAATSDPGKDTERYRRVLEDNHLVAPELGPGITHTVEVDPEGSEIVRRRRYSIS